MGALLLLAALGWGLWSAAPDPDDARVNLGTGLLVSVIVAAAVGSAQFAIDDRRTRAEDRRDELVRKTAEARDERIRQASERQDLRMTIGLQPSLVGIDLHKKDLTDFYFARKNLEEARLDHAVLVDANFEHARLVNAKLDGASLRNASLFEADLSSADLRGADLTDANLSGAKLASVDLRHAIVAGARLGADLGGLDLSQTDVAGADLRGATADSQTVWPHGFNPAAAGVVMEPTS
jgi:uncharacterized protein YjbI with pentapeptide repeats